MKKHLLLTLLAIITSFASFALGSITGPVTTCTGYVVYLSDATPGGTWSSSDASVATIDSSGGATALSAGTTTITYSLGAAYVTTSLTVYAMPAPISETSITFCTGTTATCTDATTGGTWSSGSGITVTSAGVVTGVTPGPTYVN